MKLLGLVGGRDEPKGPPPVDKLCAVRLANVRQRTRWTEIPESRLVRRARWWVDAETNELFSIHRGDLFTSDGRKARIPLGPRPTAETFYSDARRVR